MKKEFNLCNLYIVLWLISFSQNMSGAGSFMSLLVSVPQIAITMYCFVMLLSQYRPKGSMAQWMFFFFYLLLYGVFAVINSKGTTFVTMVLASVGPMIAFCYFTLKGFITEKHLLFWFVVFIIVNTIGYYANEAKVVAMLSDRNKYEEITNNAAYTFVGLLPFVFLIKKRTVFQYAILLYLMYFVVTGMKRGAILISALMLVWFVFHTTSNMKGAKRWFVLLLTLVVLVVGWKFLENFYNSSDYFQYRLDDTLEGNSSGRDLIYTRLWDYFIHNTNVIEVLFGGGAYYTTTIASGENAHNDWLELLIDCGVLGVFVYLIYWIRFLYEWVKSKRDVLLYCVLGSCIIFSFFKTLISQGFASMPFHTSMIMGYCFALVNIKFYNIQKHK